MPVTIEKSDLHFLIAEDQALMAKLIKGILKAGGFKKVVAVESGNNALSILKNHTVDFIIADWNMPNISGIELVSIIRHNPAYCHIPFLMLTMEMSKEKVIHAVEEGVDGFLRKPVTHNTLINTINKILDDYGDPDSLKNQLNCINRLNLQKKYDEALVSAQQFFKKSESPEILFAISECFYNLQNYDSAATYANYILKNERDSKTLNLLGKICMAQKKYEEAMEYFKQSSELNPSNLSRKIQIGNVYMKLGLAKEADELFNSFDETEILETNKVEMGAAYLLQGDVQKAGKYLKETLEPIPETISVFNNYAMQLRKIGEYEESIKQYEKCLKVEPKNLNVLFNSGVVYFEMGEYQNAKKRLEDALRIKPDFENAKKLLDYISSKLRNS